MAPTLSPGFTLGLGAKEARPPVVLVVGADALFATPIPPVRVGLAVDDAGFAGGPIDVRVPPTLGRGLDIVMEGFLAFDGVPVLGVDAADVPAESCFVGDFVGDWELY